MKSLLRTPVPVVRTSSTEAPESDPAATMAEVARLADKEAAPALKVLSKWVQASSKKKIRFN
jgi:hypothetical protein